MNGMERAVQYLPEGLQRALYRIPLLQQEKVQEIRLRCNGALTLSLPDGDKMVDAAGRFSDTEQPLTVFCTKEDVEKTFYRLCDFSVHSHMEEIRQGYVTSKDGIRVGVSGVWVTENGKVTAIREVRSLCLRVAKQHFGCADVLKPLFEQGVRSVLIAGEPSSGKTSILRDLGVALSEGRWGKRRRVSVVDERGEIAGMGGFALADVLTGISKPNGILQAVRTLAPEIVLLDELGTVDEVEAIIENLHAGVPAIATAHCRDMEEAMQRTATRLALERNLFQVVVFLQGREYPGRIRETVEVQKSEMDRGHIGGHGRDFDWVSGGRKTAKEDTGAGNHALLVGRPETAVAVRVGAYDRLGEKKQ